MTKLSFDVPDVVSKITLYDNIFLERLYETVSKQLMFWWVEPVF